MPTLSQLVKKGRQTLTVYDYKIKIFLKKIY